jgi:hypothetical protein
VGGDGVREWGIGESGAPGGRDTREHKAGNNGVRERKRGGREKGTILCRLIGKFITGEATMRWYPEETTRDREVRDGGEMRENGVESRGGNSERGKVREEQEEREGVREDRDRGERARGVVRERPLKGSIYRHCLGDKTGARSSCSAGNAATGVAERAGEEDASSACSPRASDGALGEDVEVRGRLRGEEGRGRGKTIRGGSRARTGGGEGGRQRRRGSSKGGRGCGGPWSRREKRKRKWMKNGGRKRKQKRI